jgi:hypothetical protein
MQQSVALIRKTKKVIVQIDIVNDKQPGFVGNNIGAQLTKAPEEPYFKANGYLGVFDVDDIQFDLNGLRFKIISRYEKVQL